jgi:ATP-grasp domain, R2K clade family 3
MDKTSLTYWFPLIEAAGIPVPKTKIVPLSKEAQNSMFNWFDGKDGDGSEAPFFEQLAAAADEIGYPIFLRTDYTSGKHDWERTCFVKSAADLKQHVFNLAEYSEICDFMGFPWSVWVVREFLPTIPLGHCPNYGNMPLCREFRFFVDDGEVLCWHPYWPMESFEQGDASLYNRLSAAPDDYASLHTLAHKAGRAVGGAWSIDILETERGWFVTDMAEAHKSFHWEGCVALAAGQTPTGGTP